MKVYLAPFTIVGSGIGAYIASGDVKRSMAIFFISIVVLLSQYIVEKIWED